MSRTRDAVRSRRAGESDADVSGPVEIARLVGSGGSEEALRPTEALARVSHRFPVLAEGRIARGYAGCFDVTPDWHPILDRVGPEGFHVAATAGMLWER